jgi:hypothetical protein
VFYLLVFIRRWYVMGVCIENKLRVQQHAKLNKDANCQNGALLFLINMLENMATLKDQPQFSAEVSTEH